MNPPYDALVIAKFLIKKAKDSKERITNLKLQKLLYYAQGWYLANFDTELFSDDIEAWKYGPAVRNVYREYKNYGSANIDIDIIDEELNQIDEGTKEYLDKFWDAFHGFTASDLVMSTHQEPPWINARKRAHEDDGEISINEMRQFFKQKLPKK